MTRLKVSRQGQSNMTEERLRSIGADLVISREQFLQCLPSAVSEQVNMLGTDGKVSVTDTIGTLMHWYDTLDTKQKERLWILILDFSMLPMPRGTVGARMRRRTSLTLSRASAPLR